MITAVSENMLERGIKIFYTNWRGQTRERHLYPLEVWWGSTEWHTDKQWLVKCVDLEDNSVKDFAFTGFLGNLTI